MAKRRGNPTQADVQKRRSQVATLLVSGRKQKEIAALLGVSPATINSDVKALREMWKASGLYEMELAMDIDLERIETMIRGLWLDASRGVVSAVDRVERLIRLRKEIIGYGYKPENAPTDPDWEPITVIEVVKDYGAQVIDGEATVIDETHQIELTPEDD